MEGEEAVKDTADSITSISEDEAALYDRQIRLWGLDAQKRHVRYVKSNYLAFCCKQ